MVQKRCKSGTNFQPKGSKAKVNGRQNLQKMIHTLLKCLSFTYSWRIARLPAGQLTRSSSFALSTL